MNKRKLVDYTSMYEALATLMKTELPEVELYFAGEGRGGDGR